MGHVVIYLDANIVIRLIEGDSAARAPLVSRLFPCRGVPRSLLTSQLTRLECRVQPIKSGNGKLLGIYDAFFAGAELEVLAISNAVVDKATEIRATHGFRTPDAIHLAAAILGGASSFLTGDLALTKCQEIAVEIL